MHSSTHSSGIKAMDFMTRKVVTATQSMTVAQLGKLMNKKRIGGVPVVDKGKLVGIVTERDVIGKVVSKGKHPSKTRVKDIMTSPPKLVGEMDEDLIKIANKMVRSDIPRVPIVDKDGKLVGIITNKDIAREAPQLINVLIEKIKINDPNMEDEPTAFGECNHCGQRGQLVFKHNMFLCDVCAKMVKPHFM